jgi:phage terminase large subunit-like protein
MTPSLSSIPLHSQFKTHQHLAALDNADSEGARKSFRQFIRRSFGVVDKSTKWRDDWYYAPICELAEAVARGQCLRAIAIHPPGTYKSGVWSVSLPAWRWIECPEQRFICASNELDLVIEQSVKSRDIVQSIWYQQSFRPSWRLRDDQKAKRFYQNTATGFRRGVSVGSTIGGKKGHTLIADDVHDYVKAQSPVIRKKDKDWFRGGLYDRMMNFQTSSIVVVGHRVGEDDIFAELMSEGGWEVLHIPERWEERYRKTYPVSVTTYRTDPRTEEGAYLRSSFGPAEEKQVRETQGVAVWDGKYQGNPVESKDSPFPPEKLRVIPAVPVGTVAVRYWDTAATTEDENPGASPSAGVLIGRQPSGRFVIIDVRRGWWNPTDRNAHMLSAAYDDKRIPGCSVTDIYIEHPGGSGGKEAAQIMVRELAGFSVHVDSVSGKGAKMFRAGPLSAQWMAGNIDIVDGDWNKGYKDRMKLSHRRTEKDDMDATAGGFNKLVGNADPTELPQTAAQTHLQTLPPGTIKNIKGGPLGRKY